jgi:hypothetical protein
MLLRAGGRGGGEGDSRERARREASPRPSTKLDILVIRLPKTRLLQNCGERNWLYGNSNGPLTALDLCCGVAVNVSCP